MQQRPLTRISPIGPPAAYKTYEIASPTESHFREATCEEISCVMYAMGWQTAVDETSELGQRQAAYIRQRANRTYWEHGEDGFTVFEFPPGETCFRTHQIPLDREPLYVVRGGDWRGNPRGERTVHATPDAWVNDFADHQDRINKALNG